MRGSFKGDKKKKQGSEYHLVDKTANLLSTGYIRFIASGSELRHVCVCVEGGRLKMKPEAKTAFSPTAFFPQH